MKKLTLISLLIFQFAFVNAQPYQSIFGDSTTSWYIDYSFEAIIVDCVYTIGDTIMNGYNYNIIGPQSGSVKFVRNDTNIGKVWVMDKNDSIEYLIMDLSVTEGDTFYLNYSFYYDTLLVDSVYFINGIKHIRLNKTTWSLLCNGYILFIEGIGPSYSIPNPISSLGAALCTYKDGNFIHSFCLGDYNDTLVIDTAMLENTICKTQIIAIIDK